MACQRDIVFFVSGFVKTIDPRRTTLTGPVVPMVLYGYQEAALEQFRKCLRDGKDCIIEKSRDMGASWLCVVFILWRWLFFKNQRILMVSRKEALVDGQQDSLFAHLDFVLDHLPNWLKPAGYKRTKLKLVNPRNGSAIEGEATNENIGRGGRRTILLWDEAAAFERGGFDVDASTQDTTNTRLINSTPKGRNTFFCSAREKGLIPIVRMHWSQHPEKRKGLYRPTPNGPEILDKDYRFPPGYAFRSEIPRSKEKVRSVWYDAQCDRRAASPQYIAQELDIDDAGAEQVFVDPRWLEWYTGEYARPPAYRGHLQLLANWRSMDKDALGFQFWTHDEGFLKVWCALDERLNFRPAQDREYVVACDIGVGSGRADSTAVVYDRVSFEKVAEFACNSQDVALFSRSVVALCRMFRVAGGKWPLLIWEANGPGGAFKRRVYDDLHYPNVWFQRDDKRAGAKISDTPGWYSDTERRETLLLEYRDALSGEHPLINVSAEALRELGQYKYEGDLIVHPSATAKEATDTDYGRNHGDRVIADALANRALGRRTLPGPMKSKQPPAPGSLLARRAERLRNERNAG